MINLWVNISNPFVSSDYLTTFWYKHGQITDHKSWEFQATTDNCILLLGLSLTTRRSHAGLRLELGLLGYSVSFEIYDNRHWDYISNSWAK